MKARIRSIGNSLGVILPKDLLRQWRLGPGDEIDIDQDGFRPPSPTNIHLQLDQLKLEISIRVLSHYSISEIRTRSLENLVRWEAQKPLAPAYLEWRRILKSGDDVTLTQAMVGRDENSNRLRQSFPYVGMLPKDELAMLRDKI